VIEGASFPSPLFDPLEPCLIGPHTHEEKAHQDKETEAYTKILNSAPVYKPRPYHKEVLSVEVQTSKDGKKIAPEVELKPLPSHLIYEFLSLNHAFPIIVNTKLNDLKLEKLLDVLRKYRGCISYSIDDIKEINPSVCMHEFYLIKVMNPLKNLKNI